MNKKLIYVIVNKIFLINVCIGWIFMEFLNLKDKLSKFYLGLILFLLMLGICIDIVE